MKILSSLLFVLLFFSCKSESKKTVPKNESKVQETILDSFNKTPILNYTTKANKISFHLKDDKGEYFNNHGNLKKYVKHKNQKLKFAMNGGMYLEDASPQGLYIEKGKEIKKLNTKKSTYGNFYMEPNGVFYIPKGGNRAQIVTSKQYGPKPEVKYATQSGPMLIINGKMHSKFTKDSKHLHIRNGVGILPNGDLFFAMSMEPINFYDFASYFAKQGCRNALYLDGAISKAYLPEKGIEQTNGRFGIIIAEIE